MGVKIVSGGTLAIIGARLNSSRLPGKHLLPLAGQPMISHIARRLLAVDAIDDIVLATTDDDYNVPLVKWSKSENVDVLAFEGDVNDLMGRIDDVVRQHDPEIIVYVCGDSPLIEPTTLQKAITAIIDQPATDTVRLTLGGEDTETIHEGFDIYRRSFWDRMVKASIKPFEREHVGSVYHALDKVAPAAVAAVEEDPIFCNINHRISVDTPSDHQFMSRIYNDWYETNAADTLVSLEWVIGRLQTEPDLAAINAHVHQKSVDETSAKIMIVTEAGPQVGFGHLARMSVAARALQDHLAAKVDILIRGQEVPFGGLDLLQYEWLEAEAFADRLSSFETDVLLIDVKIVDQPIEALLSSDSPAKIIAVDNMFHSEGPDLWYAPSFDADPDISNRLGDRLIFGWDSYLLPDLPKCGETRDQISRVIIISGATDAMRLGDNLPELINRASHAALQIDWVQGPFAHEPKISDTPHHDWKILKAPQNLAQTLYQYDAAICAYGVSLFECLKAGVPTVALRAPGQISDAEWSAFTESGAALTADNEDSAVAHLRRLIGDPELHKSLSTTARGLLASSDGRKMADAVKKLLEQRP